PPNAYDNPRSALHRHAWHQDRQMLSEQALFASPWGEEGPVVVWDNVVPADDRGQVSGLFASWNKDIFGTGPLEVSPLPGGANNRNYVVKGPRIKYALRLANPQNDRFAVDRRSALRAQRDAAAVHVAPALVASQLPDGHLLSSF